MTNALGSYTSGSRVNFALAEMPLRGRGLRQLRAFCVSQFYFSQTNRVCHFTLFIQRYLRPVLFSFFFIGREDKKSEVPQLEGDIFFHIIGDDANGLLLRISVYALHYQVSIVPPEIMEEDRDMIGALFYFASLVTRWYTRHRVRPAQHF